MTVEINVNALATAIGDDVQQILVNQGSLTLLNTTDKSNLVAAINEVLSAIASAGGGDLLSANNLSDLASAIAARSNLDVGSTSEVTAEIAAAVSGLTLSALGGLDQSEVDARVQTIVDSAPAALDTLNEIAAALGDDADFSATIATQMGNRVRFDAAQSLSLPQQFQACTNIGVGDPEADYLATYVAARDA